MHFATQLYCNGVATGTAFRVAVGWRVSLQDGEWVTSAGKVKLYRGKPRLENMIMV